MRHFSNSAGRARTPRAPLGIPAFPALAAALWLALSAGGALAADPPEPAPEGDSEPTQTDAAAAPTDAASALAAEVPAETKIRVMVPTFRASSPDILPGDIDTITGLAVFQLSRVKRFDVISGADIEEMLRLEGEKQTLGCSDDSSCLSEIAGALDARLVLFGQIGLLGARFVVNLALIDSHNAQVVSRTSFQSKGLSALARDLPPAINDLAIAFGGLPGDFNRGQAQTGLARQVAQWANGPDTVMLITNIVLGMGALFLPLCPFIPGVQAAVFALFGPDISGRNYPSWWLQALAGYAALAVGVSLSSALLGVATVLLPVLSSVDVVGPALNNTLPFGIGGTSLILTFAGVGAFFTTLLIFEPFLSWGVGIYGAEDARQKLDEVDVGAASSEDDDGASSDEVGDGDDEASETPADDATTDDEGIQDEAPAPQGAPGMRF